MSQPRINPAAVRAVIADVFGDDKVAYLTTRDVARLEGTTPASVRNLKHQGKIDGWQRVDGIGLRLHVDDWAKSFVARGGRLPEIGPREIA